MAKVLADNKELVARFYTLSKGSVENIGILLSVIAGEPIPVDVLFQLLKIDDQQKSEAKALGKMPVARLEQLEEAIVSSVEESDTSEKYRKFLTEQIERFEVVEKVMNGLNEIMTKFHTKAEGALSKIEDLFVDMAPEPQKGKPMPPGMINMLLQVPPTATTCSLEEFLECFRRNLDTTDSVDKLKPIFEAHIAK